MKEHIIRSNYGSRGGGVEISLDFVGAKYKGYKMTAYQNYLGGGILGKICSDCNKPEWENDKKLLKVSEDLKRYFHELTNPEDGYESFSYENNQNLPVSAY